MDEQNIRMLDRDNQPDEAQVEAWLGLEAYRCWRELRDWIEDTYPGVFSPDWLYGGKKHGWSLRYKKSKSFCTLVPEKGRLAVMIVFGGPEREKVEAIRGALSGPTLALYDQAATYHDGKWVLLAVESEQVLEDVRRLLAVKRRSKRNPIS